MEFFRKQLTTLGQYLSKSGTPEEEKDIQVLPQDVIYALRYKKAALDKKELATLLNAGFINESIYLVIKILDKHPEAQRELLQSLVEEIVANPSDLENLRAKLNQGITQIEETDTVEAAKLAQLSRQGFKFWDNLYKNAAHDVVSELKPKIPALVAYASLEGLRHFIEALKMQGQNNMYIIIPGWVDDQQLKYAGYEINLARKNEKVRFLPKEFARYSSVVIIDDTHKTGQRMNQLLEFWQHPPSSVGQEAGIEPVIVPEVETKILFEARDY